MFTDCRYRRPALAILAALLAVAPYFGARALLDGHIRAEAGKDVAELAGEFVSRTARAVDDGLDVLAGLAGAGVSGCSPHDLELMRRAAAATFAVRDVAVAGPDGAFACNQAGDPLPVVEASLPLPVARNASVRLQVVRLREDGGRSLFLTWAQSGSTLAAVIPAEAAALDVLPSRLRGLASGEVGTTDGAILSAIGARRPGASSAGVAEPISAEAVDGDYPIRATLTAPYAVFRAEASMLAAAINVAGAAMALLAVALIAYALRQAPANENAVRDAIARNEFVPYYQPVIDIRHGRLMGCEVLIRWRKPDGSIVPPSAFIALAEATGLAIPMTRALMARARDEMNQAYGDRPHLKLSINLFHDHFATPGIVSDIRSIFGPSRIAFDQLVLEVTERHPLPDNAATREVIRSLQELGARIALDDAGTGHSGLANLQRLGLDVLKIDKLFIDVISKAGHPATVADSLIRLGQDLGMEVVAEGVEHVDQVEYLRAHGVFAAQGYLFAPALPGPSFLRLIESMEPSTPAPANDSAPAVPVARARTA